MRKLWLGSIGLVAAAIGPAWAADVPAKPVYKAPPPVVAPVYNWTGPYVGGNLGYSWGRAASDFSIPSSTAPAPAPGFGLSPITIPGVAFTDTSKPKGIIGGGQVGYNWQAFNNLVLGLEADVQASGEKAGSSPAEPFSFVNQQSNTICTGICSTNVAGTTSTPYETRISWFGTVRGRAGFAWNNLLLYGTGGLAYGRVAVSGMTTVSGTESCIPTTPCALSARLPMSFVAGTTAFGASRINVGWTAGGGIEWAFIGSWSLKLEYLYIDLGRLGISATTSTGSLETVSTRFTDNIVRAGLNYRFDWGKAAAIARY